MTKLEWVRCSWGWVARDLREVNGIEPGTTTWVPHRRIADVFVPGVNVRLGYDVDSTQTMRYTVEFHVFNHGIWEFDDFESCRNYVESIYALESP